MKALGRNGFGFSGALAVLPAAGILLASLTACSVGDSTTAPNAETQQSLDHAPLQVDPPELEDGSGGDGGSAPPPPDGNGGGGGRDGDPPSGEDTFGEDS